MSKDPRVYLVHILEALRKIAAYTQDGQQQFLNESVIQDAVIRNFEIIGEAAKQVPDDFRQRNPEIPWRGLAAFRDMLIHRYQDVDLEEVWNIVAQESGALQQAIERVLPPLDQLEQELADEGRTSS